MTTSPNPGATLIIQTRQALHRPGTPPTEPPRWQHRVTTHDGVVIRTSTTTYAHARDATAAGKRAARRILEDSRHIGGPIWEVTGHVVAS